MDVKPEPFLQQSGSSRAPSREPAPSVAEPDQARNTTRGMNLNIVGFTRQPQNQNLPGHFLEQSSSSRPPSRGQAPPVAGCSRSAPVARRADIPIVEPTRQRQSQNLQLETNVKPGPFLGQSSSPRPPSREPTPPPAVSSRLRSTASRAAPSGRTSQTARSGTARDESNQPRKRARRTGVPVVEPIIPPIRPPQMARRSNPPGAEPIRTQQTAIRSSPFSELNYQSQLDELPLDLGFLDSGCYESLRRGHIARLGAIKFNGIVPEGLKLMFKEFLKRYASLWTIVRLKDPETSREGIDLIDITSYLLAYKHWGPDGSNHLFFEIHKNLEKMVRDLCRNKSYDEQIVDCLWAFEGVDEAVRPNAESARSSI